jgi:hypothetical protein
MLASTNSTLRLSVMLLLLFCSHAGSGVQLSGAHQAVQGVAL